MEHTLCWPAEIDADDRTQLMEVLSTNSTFRSCSTAFEYPFIAIALRHRVMLGRIEADEPELDLILAASIPHATEYISSLCWLNHGVDKTPEPQHDTGRRRRRRAVVAEHRVTLFVGFSSGHVATYSVDGGCASVIRVHSSPVTRLSAGADGRTVVCHHESGVIVRMNLDDSVPALPLEHSKWRPSRHERSHAAAAVGLDCIATVGTRPALCLAEFDPTVEVSSFGQVASKIGKSLLGWAKRLVVDPEDGLALPDGTELGRRAKDVPGVLPVIVRVSNDALSTVDGITVGPGVVVIWGELDGGGHTVLTVDPVMGDVTAAFEAPAPVRAVCLLDGVGTLAVELDGGVMVVRDGALLQSLDSTGLVGTGEGSLFVVMDGGIQRITPD